VVMGCDLSGIVQEVGGDVRHVKVGDKVGALLHGSRYEHTGAFAEYAAAIGDVVWKKPDHLSHEENATFGVGNLTAIACLFQKLALPTPLKHAPPFPFLVWSGATSVGQFAIQYAKLAGATVTATASPKNHELLKSLGATHVFDYRDPDVVKKIKEVTHNQLEYGIDCISEAESQAKSEESLGEKGGKIAIILRNEKKTRDDVEFVYELLYSAMGRPFTLRGKDFPAVPQDREFIRDFIKNEFNQLVQERKVTPNALKLMSGGLSGIPEGLEYLKSGKASAEKLVYHIQDE